MKNQTGGFINIVDMGNSDGFQIGSYNYPKLLFRILKLMICYFRMSIGFNTITGESIPKFILDTRYWGLSPGIIKILETI